MTPANARVQFDEPTAEEGGIPYPRRLDICLGRGGMANNHCGNKAYRDILSLYKFEYRDAESRYDKSVVVAKAMAQLESEEFRFVEKNKRDGLWYPVCPKRAKPKVIQTLREYAFELERMENGDDARVAPEGVTVVTRESLECCADNVDEASTENDIQTNETDGGANNRLPLQDIQAPLPALNVLGTKEEDDDDLSLDSPYLQELLLMDALADSPPHYSTLPWVDAPSPPDNDADRKPAAKIHQRAGAPGARKDQQEEIANEDGLKPAANMPNSKAKKKQGEQDDGALKPAAKTQQPETKPRAKRKKQAKTAPTDNDDKQDKTLLEDHEVVLKEIAETTPATRVFKDHTRMIMPRGDEFEMDNLINLHNQCYRCKFFSKESPSMELPSVTFWVSLKAATETPSWALEPEATTRDIRYSKKKATAFVRASEVCLRHDIGINGGRSPKIRSHNQASAKVAATTDAAEPEGSEASASALFGDSSLQSLQAKLKRTCNQWVEEEIIKRRRFLDS